MGPRRLHPRWYRPAFRQILRDQEDDRAEKDAATVWPHPCSAIRQCRRLARECVCDRGELRLCEAGLILATTALACSSCVCATPMASCAASAEAWAALMAAEMPPRSRPLIVSGLRRIGIFLRSAAVLTIICRRWFAVRASSLRFAPSPGSRPGWRRWPARPRSWRGTGKRSLRCGDSCFGRVQSRAGCSTAA